MNQSAMLLITSMNKLVVKKKHSKLQFRKPIFHTRSQKAEKVRGRKQHLFYYALLHPFIVFSTIPSFCTRIIVRKATFASLISQKWPNVRIVPGCLKIY